MGAACSCSEGEGDPSGLTGGTTGGTTGLPDPDRKTNGGIPFVGPLANDEIVRSEKLTPADERASLPHLDLDEHNVDRMSVKTDDGQPVCAVCGVYLPDQEIYGCRICPRVFHQECLERVGQCSDSMQRSMLERANTPVGWSCYVCNNLHGLLTGEEVKTLEGQFRKFDCNRDSSISLREYLDYRKELYKKEGRPWEKEDEALERARFDRIDTNGSGQLDWHEFINHECIKFLAKRSKSALVRLLSEKEVNNAKATFKSFDENGDGHISREEASQLFDEWYKKAANRRRKSETGLSERFRRKYRIPSDFDHECTPVQWYIISDASLSDGPLFDAYLQQQTQMIMDADSDHDGVVIWEEFIKEQALYIIAARPNKFYLGPPLTAGSAAAGKL